MEENESSLSFSLSLSKGGLMRRSQWEMSFPFSLDLKYHANNFFLAFFFLSLIMKNKLHELYQMIDERAHMKSLKLTIVL